MQNPKSRSVQSWGRALGEKRCMNRHEPDSHIGEPRELSSSLALGPILGARLFPVSDALRVEHPADDVIANAGKVPYPAATNEHDRVFLQVMTFARDVGRHFHPIRKSNPRYFAERGVGFL